MGRGGVGGSSSPGKGEWARGAGVGQGPGARMGREGNALLPSGMTSCFSAGEETRVGGGDVTLRGWHWLLFSSHRF